MSRKNVNRFKDIYDIYNQKPLQHLHIYGIKH